MNTFGQFHEQITFAWSERVEKSIGIHRSVNWSHAPADQPNPTSTDLAGFFCTIGSAQIQTLTYLFFRSKGPAAATGSRFFNVIIGCFYPLFITTYFSNGWWRRVSGDTSTCGKWSVSLSWWQWPYGTNTPIFLDKTDMIWLMERSEIFLFIHYILLYQLNYLILYLLYILHNIISNLNIINR